MNEADIPAKLFIDKSRGIVKFVPETKIEMAKYDETIWKARFPPIADYSRLQLTNVGIYSIARPKIAQDMMRFLTETCLENKIIKSRKDFAQMTITETFGGLGGFLLELAKHFGHINTVELNPIHIKCMENNLKVYGYDKTEVDIKILNEDYLDVAFNLKQDIIICDPPWGGLDYRKKRFIKLGVNNVNIVHIINELHKQRAFKVFVLLAMINFDMQDFIQNIKVRKFVIHKLERHYFILILA
jgi:predicted RNA methylase